MWRKNTGKPLLYDILTVYALRMGSHHRNPKLLIEEQSDNILKNMEDYRKMSTDEGQHSMVSGGTVANYIRQIEEHGRITGNRIADLEYMLFSMFNALYLGEDADLAKMELSIIVTDSRDFEHGDVAEIYRRVLKEDFEYCKKLIQYALRPNNTEMYHLLIEKDDDSIKEGIYNILFYFDIGNSKSITSARKTIEKFEMGFNRANNTSTELHCQLYDEKSKVKKPIDLLKYQRVIFIIDGTVRTDTLRAFNKSIREFLQGINHIDLWINQTETDPSPIMDNIAAESYRLGNPAHSYKHISDVLLNWFKIYIYQSSEELNLFSIKDHTLLWNEEELISLTGSSIYEKASFMDDIDWEEKNDLAHNDESYEILRNIEAKLYAEQVREEYVSAVERMLLIELQPKAIANTNVRLFRKRADKLVKEKAWEWLAEHLLEQLDRKMKTYQQQMQNIQSKIRQELGMRYEYLQYFPEEWTDGVAERMLADSEDIIGYYEGYRFLEFFRETENVEMEGKVLARFEEYLEKASEAGSGASLFMFQRQLYKFIEEYCEENDLIDCELLYRERAEAARHLGELTKKKGAFRAALGYRNNVMKMNPWPGEITIERKTDGPTP